MFVLHGIRLCRVVVGVLIASIAIWIPDILLYFFVQLETGDSQDLKYVVYRITPPSSPSPPPLPSPHLDLKLDLELELELELTSSSSPLLKQRRISTSVFTFVQCSKVV